MAPINCGGTGALPACHRAWRTSRQKLILSRYLAEWQDLPESLPPLGRVQQNVLNARRAGYRQRFLQLVKALLVGHCAVNVDDAPACEPLS